MQEGRTQSLPSFRHALVTFGTTVVVISTGLFYLGTSLHSLMLGCLIIAATSAMWLGYSYTDIRKAMNSGIAGALNAIYIFIMIGVLIAALIESGALATLIYSGIHFIEPTIFLPAGLLLCSLMSVATGTSWGTVGTAGVILVGIGSAMGFPPALVAGMVVSGACFGDKMSPVSDTTNLAAMSSSTSLYDHIRSMCYTTAPAYVLALICFILLGLNYSDAVLPQAQLQQLTTALSDTFTIHWLTIVPLVVMVVLSVMRVPAEVAMMAASGLSVILAVSLQDRSLSVVLNSLFDGSKIHTGVSSLDSLLGRGGIMSMMWTLSLALIALALGGILNHVGFLKVLVQGILRRIKSAVVLVATTIVSCFVGNASMGEAYMSIIFGGQLFGEAYDKQGLSRSVLSRSLEEGATMTTPLIPWTTAGAFYASTMGISVLDYAPWALLNWLNPLLGILAAACGIGLFARKTVAKDSESPADIATEST